MYKDINWRFSEKDIERVREVLKSNFSASNSTNMCQQLEELFAEKVGAELSKLKGTEDVTIFRIKKKEAKV